MQVARAHRENAMRVGLLTYPMLFQVDSVLRDEVRAMLAAFEAPRPSLMHDETELSLV